MTRHTIIETYRQRIDEGKRTLLSRRERDALIDSFVGILRPLQTEEDIKQVCQQEIALLEEGYPQSSVGSVLIPAYRRAISEAIASGDLPLTPQTAHEVPWEKMDGSASGVSQEHFALAYMKYDRAMYAALKKPTIEANNERQDDLQPVCLDAYLERVTQLLQSNQPEELAIALTALTGRRHTEVVAVGQFSPMDHPYMLYFEGQQKKKTDDSQGFAIPSLIPVADVMGHLDRFRAMPEIADLAGRDDDDPSVQAFNTRVNTRVQTYFGNTGIIPVLAGFKTVSIHRLRALYGAIALHYFCANNQHPHRFLQLYLGHVADMASSPNSRSTDHYFHYYLTRSDGTPISVRGVKLMAHGPLSSTPKSPPYKPQKQSSIRTLKDELPRWNHLMGAIAPHAQNQAERMSALLEWAESRLTVDPQVVAHLAESVSVLALENQRLREKMAEMAELKSAQPSAEMEAVLDDLRRENAALRADRAKLNQMKKLMGANGQDASEEKPPDPSPAQTAGEMSRADQVVEAIKDWNRRFPDRSFAINSRLLDQGLGLLSRRDANAFVDHHADELTLYHQSIGVTNDKSHNRQVGRREGGKDDLKAFVLEYLGQQS